MMTCSLKQLSEIVSKQAKSDVVEKEYDELEQVPPAPGSADDQHDKMVSLGLCQEAVKNESKNRYCNLFPFDKNVVKLSDGYINASWIRFEKENPKYVITMAPLDGHYHSENTCPDFWNMCWEVNAKVVVMMCVVDGGCPQYFPNKVSESINAPFLIKNLTTAVEKDHTERTLQISKNGEKRVINHFQYTAWPNYGVPNDVKSIGQFVKYIHQRTQEIYTQADCLPKSPYLIIHCSGGVGRSGAFLTMFKTYSDLISSQSKGNIPDHLPLKDTVLMMRHQRHPWMVEGLHQYQLVYNGMGYLVNDLLENGEV